MLLVAFVPELVVGAAGVVAVLFDASPVGRRAGVVVDGSGLGDVLDDGADVPGGVVVAFPLVTTVEDDVGDQVGEVATQSRSGWLDELGAWLAWHYTKGVRGAI